MLQGPPASGKSTWAREQAEKHSSEYVIVNRDSIRRSRGKYWLPSQEDYITDIEEFEIRAAIKRGLSPIIDATNLNPQTISKWENLAKELKVELEIKKFYVSYKEALKRDSVREFPVGEKTLTKFYIKYFQKEYNEEIYQLDKIKINSKSSAFIIDLDGTLAYAIDRGIYEYDKANSDIVDPRLKQVICDLISIGYTPIFITGRSNSSREIVLDWLRTNVFRSETLFDPWILKMRKANDFRPSVEIKEKALESVEHDYNILFAIDDSSEVVEMYRNHGIYACKVN